MLFKNYLLKFAPALILGLTSLPTNASAEVFDGLIISNPVFSRTASLIDTNRQVVHSWNFATTPAYVVYLMPDSSIWRPDVYSGAVMRGGVYGGLIQHYDWYGNIIKSFVWSDSNHQQHHDIHPMPNGHILLLSWDRKTQTEAQAMGRVNINGDMWAEEIIEYDPETDSVVWEWHVWDHMIQDVDPSKPNYGVVREHPELIDINLGTLFMYGDWIHANIIDYNEERDEIVFCSHFLNELYVIDHSTTTEEAKGHTGGRHGKGGDIIYRWGNPQNYDRGDSTDQRFFVVHGANWIRPGLPGAGNILVFNNGDRPGNNNDYSEVIEITPPLDSNDHYYIHPDSAFGPAAPTWIYSNPGTFYSGHMSGAYRLPNGNTFITEAVSGRLFEVTYEGQVVWECPTSSWNGRALKYPRNYLSSINQELTAQPPNLRLIYKRINRSGEPVTIGFNLPIRGKVSLLIYDALGRKIASLPLAMTEKGEYPAGEHQFQVSLPERQNLTGVYFLQLIVNTPKQSNRPVMGKIIMTK